MPNNNMVDAQPTYRSLSEIRLRKAQLITEITKDNNKMRKMWGKLFNKSQQPTTPSRRITSIMSRSASMFDAAILGWKLYQRGWKLYQRFGGSKKKGKKFKLF